MKSTTAERLAQCSTTMRYRQHTVEELDAMVIETINKWREHCRQCAARGTDPWESMATKGVPFWTEEMLSHRDRMRAEGRLVKARVRVCAEGTENGTQKAVWRNATPTERQKLEANDRFGPFWPSNPDLAEKYEGGGHVPAQPRPIQEKKTRTTITLWPSWLPYALLGALGFTLGYTILHRYV